MQVAELIILLETQAKTSLLNQEEVTQAVLERASLQALELVENKPIPTTMLVDLAMLRLMLLLKVQPTELEAQLANQALKKAQSLQVSETGTISSSVIAYGDRESIWTLPSQERDFRVSEYEA